MIYIAHRGNIEGPNIKDENSPEYIDKAIEAGFQVEADVWLSSTGWFLGHTQGQYPIGINWLLEREEYLWIHAKNNHALRLFSSHSLKHLNYYWHQTDEYTLTSKGYIWVYPGEAIFRDSICVLPELHINGYIKDCYAICTDYPIKYKEIYG